MSKKLLIVNLLIAAILASWVVPTAVLGITTDFHPKNQDYGTGYMEKQLLFTGGRYYRKRTGPIMVGYIHNTTSSDYWYRGFADFDISSLPADACVSDIKLIGTTMGISQSPGHYLEIRHLTEDPITNGSFNLYDAIGTGSKYISCSACMRQPGTKTVTLPSSSWTHLEAAQAQGWFALGFTELNEDDLPGLWSGWADPSPPILRVTYNVPPRSAPSPAISVDSICSGAEFCVTWNAVSNATSYQIKEAGGLWTSVGTNTSKCYTKNVAGDYTFYVRARNACGIGPSGSTAIKVINVPATPNKPVGSGGPYCVDVNYTISWTPLAGANTYQIREDNGGWISVGNTTQRTFNHSTVGSHNYAVRGVNMCGIGNPSSTVSVSVMAPPAAPAAPTASDATPCPNVNVTISWREVPRAIEYRLTELLSGKKVYVGTGLHWNGLHQSGSFQYALEVRVNSCGWSDVSRPVSVNVKRPLAAPRAPVSDKDTANVGETYTISWERVTGATSYELYEDGTTLIYRGPELSSTMSQDLVGDFTYSVKACDECGCSALGAELTITVGQHTAVEEIDAPKLPDGYSLSQNYPNPFNPETRIEFSLKRSSYVELTVFNVLGKTIRSLVKDRLSAGYKAVTWDGRDNYGRQVSSGVYLYKLTAGEFTATEKMMLIK